MAKKILLQLFIIVGIWFPLKAQEGILFNETFDDAQLNMRGWYDGRSCRISENFRLGSGLLNNAQKLWIDELVVSTQPIGPVSSKTTK